MPGFSVSIDNSGAAVDLTALGPDDWIHWGTDGTPANPPPFGDASRKNIVTPLIQGFYTANGANFLKYTNDVRLASWSDGDPDDPVDSGVQRGVNTDLAGATGIGYQVNVPATAGVSRVVLLVGGYDCGCTLTARLSDGSASNYSDTLTLVANTSQYRTYTIDYSANGPCTLELTWLITTLGAGFPNATIKAAALDLVQPTPVGVAWLRA